MEFHFAAGLSYRGTAFNGWQRQPGLPTVQGTVEQALSRIADHDIGLSVAGRTDAGVHATGQVIAFTSPVNRSPEVWQRGLNGLTPDGIRVNWVQAVDAAFHPRYRATARTYQYVFFDQARENPFLQELAWCTDALNADRMHQQAQSLLGEQDFSSFRAAGCQSLTPFRRVDRCEVRRCGGLVVMEITANAFLLHMVRNIASALRDIGRDHDVESMASRLGRRDRRKLGITAPPQGLYLVQVAYPEQAFPESPQPSFLPDY